ncbi:MAG TPA: response regulator [Thermoanaerobaculia bacterium]|nr:response regulator [Thermoanaerobaculia bacterium]
MSTARVLIADDDRSIRGLLRVMAERGGLDIVEAVNGAEAIARIRREPFDLILLDIAMPMTNGLEVIDVIRQMRPRPAVFVLTALARAVFAELDPAIVTCVVRKPFDAATLAPLIVDIANGVHGLTNPLPLRPAPTRAPRSA